MLALLAIICTGGVKAAVGDTYKLVTSVDELKAGDVIVIGAKDYNAVMGPQNTNNRKSVIVTISNEQFTCVAGVEELTLEVSSGKWQFLTSDNKYLCASGSSSTSKSDNKLTSTADNTLASTKATITISSNNAKIQFDGQAKSKIVRCNPNTGSPNGPLFSCYAGTQKNIQIYKKQEATKADPEIAFKETEKTVELKEGAIELSTLISNPHALPVTYTSSNDEVAKVSEGVIHMYKTGKVDITAKFAGNDTYNAAEKTLALTIEDNRADAGIHFEKDSYTADINKDEFKGAVLVNPNKLAVTYSISPDDETALIDPASGFVIYTKGTEASYEVTAKFSGNEIYKPATVTYTLNVEDPNCVAQIVTFDAAVDKGSTKNTGDDKIIKNGVTIDCTNAALNYGDNYRFYSNSSNLITFSVEVGKITKIEFENTGDKALTNLKLKEENGTFAAIASAATWTGNSNKIIFTAIAQARATKITVTVKVPVAKDFTLDEKEVNEIEDWENSNVTVKRTFYKDGDWNTLCLPFDVSAKEVKAAFGSDAQLRQVDEANSKDNTVAFTTATAIKAGVPYLIKFDKLAENADQPQEFNHTFEGVTLTKKVEYSALADFNIIFTGSYSAFTPEDFLKEYNTCDVVASMAAANTLKKVYAGTTIKGLRAVFGLSSSVQPQAVKVVIDGTTTGIGDLHVDGASVANGRVYNLNGQCVGTSLEGLKAGVYIQNGKKVIINK